MNTNGRFLDVTSFEMTQFFWVCQFLGLIPYCTFLKVSKLSNVHQKSLNTYTFKHLHCHLYREKSESSSSPDRQTDRLLNVFVCSFFNCCVLFIYSLFIFYLISSNHIKMSLLSCWSASTPVTAATLLTWLKTELEESEFKKCNTISKVNEDLTNKQKIKLHNEKKTALNIIDWKRSMCVLLSLPRTNPWWLMKWLRIYNLIQ